MARMNVNETVTVASAPFSGVSYKTSPFDDVPMPQGYSPTGCETLSPGPPPRSNTAVVTPPKRTIVSPTFPQPTGTLIKRLHRAAKGLRRMSTPSDVLFLAWANTCDQAAGRLADYADQFGSLMPQADDEAQVVDRPHEVSEPRKP